MCKHGFLKGLCLVCTLYYLILLTVAATYGNVLANQSSNDELVFTGNSGEFKLTKLLNIEIGGTPEKSMDGKLHNTVLSEIQRGIRNELGNSESLGPVKAPQENYSEKEVATILRELNSEIAALKRNMTNVAVVRNPSSECLIQSDILNGDSYPVGVSFHRFCHPNNLNMEVTETKKYFPRSCKEIQQQGNNVSGMYQIQPKKSETPLMVLCDMETREGGWTHIHKRFDGSVDFFLGWREYKFGFGDLGSEFWIGLENIYKMTSFEVNELLVEIVDRENNKAYAHYNAFGIGPEAEGYPLNTLSGFSGAAGDSLTHHLGCKFTTKDFDQDSNSGNCAVLYSGAWWYRSCHASNLNGKYMNAVPPNQYISHGMIWAGFKGIAYCHAKSRMLVRPAE